MNIEVPNQTEAPKCRSKGCNYSSHPDSVDQCCSWHDPTMQLAEKKAKFKLQEAYLRRKEEKEAELREIKKKPERGGMRPNF